MADTDWVGKLSGAAGEAKARYQDETAKLNHAVKRSDSIILSPRDILTGEWDAARTLETTLGGIQRHITKEDLAAFSQNIDTVKQRHTLEGIKAQQIIDLSDALDRKRTSSSYKLGKKTIAPITQASPVLASGQVIRFITNAGGSTPGITRHHVVVEFVKLNAFASAAKRGDKDTTIRAFTQKTAKDLVKSPLKFYCDCERHKYWYCYIATIGNFALGKPYGLLQHGYPKITNPTLDGIACKHVIRVMREITTSPHVQSYLAKHLEKITLSHKKQGTTQQSQKDAEILARTQANRPDHTVQTTDEKKAAAADAKAARAAKAKQAITKLAAKAPVPERKTPKLKQAEAAADKVAALRAALAQFNLEPTQEQINAVLKG